MKYIIKFISLSFFSIIVSCTSSTNKKESTSPEDFTPVATENIPEPPKLSAEHEEQLATKKTLETIPELTEMDSSKCRCTGFLIDPDTTGTNVRETPGGKIIFTIKNIVRNSSADGTDYRLFNIIRSEGNWFYVEAGHFEEVKFEGYLHNSLVGSGFNFPDFDIYDKPNKNVINHIKAEGWGYQVKHLSCKLNWSKIEFDLDGVNYKGWVKSRSLCGSPYTTCG